MFFVRSSICLMFFLYLKIVVQCFSIVCQCFSWLFRCFAIVVLYWVLIQSIVFRFASNLCVVRIYEEELVIVVVKAGDQSWQS